MADHAAPDTKIESPDYRSKMEQMLPEESIHFEEALIKYVGGFGRFQKLVLVLFCAATVVLGCLSMEVVFTAAKTDYFCVSGMDIGSIKNGSDDLYQKLKTESDVFNVTLKDGSKGGKDNETKWDQCFIRPGDNGTEGMEPEKCTDWVYDKSQYKSTFVTEYDLVCDKHMLVPMVKSLTMVGKTVGGILAGAIADRLGRRAVLRACAVLLPLCRLVEIFVPSFTVFATFYTIRCSLLTVVYLTLFILMTEMVDPSKRALVGTLSAVFFAVGFVFLSLVAYLVRERWLLQVITTIPTLLLLIFVFLPESPRWFYARGKKRQGYESLAKVAKINGRELPENLSIIVQHETVVEKKGNCCQNCTKGIIVRVLIMNFAWFSTSMVYYALTLNIDELAGNVYLNTVIMVVVEVAGDFTAQFAMSTRLGRRLTSTLVYIVAGVPLLLTIAIPPHLSLVATALACVGRFGIAAAYNIVYIYAAELFPTTMRSIGMSTTNTSSKIGGGLAPFIWKLAVFNKAIPMSIYGTFSLVTAILCLLLPETRGRALPQNMEEMNKEKKDKNIPENNEKI